MRFVHQRERLNRDDVAITECSQQCNICLMNDANFRSLKSGGRHDYHDGIFDRFSTKIKVPSTGFWNTIIDIVIRCPTSVTHKPDLRWLIKSICRSGSQFT